MEFFPGAPVFAQAGVAATLVAMVAGFVWAILRGNLEPRQTSVRVEKVLEDRYRQLEKAYEVSEQARAEALDIARESLIIQRSALEILQGIRRAAEGD